jgi:hypothetical protein
LKFETGTEQGDDYGDFRDPLDDIGLLEASADS